MFGSLLIWKKRGKFYLFNLALMKVVQNKMVDFQNLRFNVALLRLTTSVPVSTSFIELDAATALNLGLIIKLNRNPARIAAKVAQPMRLQGSK